MTPTHPPPARPDLWCRMVPAADCLNVLAILAHDTGIDTGPGPKNLCRLGLAPKCEQIPLWAPGGSL